MKGNFPSGTQAAKKKKNLARLLTFLYSIQKECTLVTSWVMNLRLLQGTVKKSPVVFVCNTYILSEKYSGVLTYFDQVAPLQEGKHT